VFGPAIQAFESANPGVTVEYTPTPWETITEKYTTAFAAGDPPDLMYSFTGGYVDGVVGYCYDINEIFSPEEVDFLKTGVAESLFAETRVNGKLVSVPFFTTGSAVVYNKKLLAAAGYKDLPNTTDDLVTYGRKLTKDTNGDGTIDVYGWGQNSYDNYEVKPEIFLYLFGDELFNDDMSDLGYNNPAGLAAFKFVDKMWNQEKIGVPPGLYPGTTPTDAFFDGKFAMINTHSQIGVHLDNYPDFEMGVGPMPQGPGKELADGRGTYAGSGFWCIPEKTKVLEEAKKLMLVFYDPKFQGPIAEAINFIPANKNIEISADPITKAFADVYLNYGVPYRFGAEAVEVRQAVLDAMEGLQSGALTAQKAWEQAVSRGNEAFQ
jgi:multiple sugar transport system substrate-binding protein